MSGVLQGPIRPNVRLWRIEHPKDGIGPFQKYDWDEQKRPHLSTSTPGGYEWCDDRAPLHPLRMPDPRCDKLVRKGANEAPLVRIEIAGREHSHLRFAFTCLRGLRRWFPVWALEDITSKGYVVLAVACPWEAHTRWQNQARYDANVSTVLRTYRPTDLLSLR